MTALAGRWVACAAALAIAGCGQVQAVDPPAQALILVSVVAPATSAAIGGVAVPFTATVANASTTAVTWRVNGIAGGNESVGTISAAGEYLTPNAMPASGVVEISALAAADGRSSGSAQLTLLPPTRPTPASISIAPTSVVIAAGSGSQQFTASVVNATGTGVRWLVDGTPGGDATLGTIDANGFYHAPATASGTTAVSVTAVAAADPQLSASATVTLTISVPSIGGTPVTRIAVTQPYDFRPTASNPAGLPMTFGLTGAPAWVLFNAANGELSGTPGKSNLGASLITITASDGVAQASMSFTLTVTAAPPLISGTPPASAFVNQAYDFRPVAVDPNGLPLSFGISGKPAWAGFNGATGELSGTPSAANVGSFAVTLTASNGQQQAALAFTITVAARAPLLAGTPPQNVAVGESYDFRPQAADPNGLALTFSITGKPAWASFNTATGELAGTPSAADVGAITVAITASDGIAQASLPFTVNVVQFGPGTATASWTPPTTRSDGTPLTNLAGYNLYYGTDLGAQPHKITVANPSVTSYLITGLGSGLWSFVATAYDAEGIESAFSNVATKTIP